MTMVRSLGIRVSDERKGGRVKWGIRTEELGTTADGRRKRQFAPLAPSTYSLQIPTLIRGSVQQQHNSPRTCDEAQYNFPPRSALVSKTRHSIDSPLAFGVVVSTHLTTETCSTIDFVSFGTSWSTPRPAGAQAERAVGRSAKEVHSYERTPQYSQDGRRRQACFGVLVVACNVHLNNLTDAGSCYVLARTSTRACRTREMLGDWIVGDSEVERRVREGMGWSEQRASEWRERMSEGSGPSDDSIG
ncbi:hypothetical protein BC629DRAFT_1445643 [Irpex lacteus]|nr:hypothetical protein BC629DRAFT_1445643 [Irpex lacteus]